MTQRKEQVKSSRWKLMLNPPFFFLFNEISLSSVVVKTCGNAAVVWSQRFIYGDYIAYDFWLGKVHDLTNHLILKLSNGARYCYTSTGLYGSNRGGNQNRPHDIRAKFWVTISRLLNSLQSLRFVNK